jgi:hypothetical protein
MYRKYYTNPASPPYSRTKKNHSVLRVFFFAMALLSLVIGGWSMSAAPPPASPAVNLDQASNGGIGKTPISPVGWENGNQNGQKAHYNEGESIPYRARVTGLTAGQTYRATFGYDITHSSKHAIDYITSNNRIAEVVDPCDGTGQPVISPCVAGTPGDIPAPGSGAAGFFNTLVGLEGTQVVKIFNGDIPVNGVEFITQGDQTLAQSETTFRVTFTATSSTVVLSWGGHIARSIDWGAGLAATGISGSPYHTRAKSLDVPSGAGFSAISIGNQDRALASSAVLPPAPCTLSGDGARACGSKTTTHELQGAPSTSSTYSFSFVSGGATANIDSSNVNPSSAGCTDGDATTPCIFATVTATASYVIRLTNSNGAGTETCDATVTIDATPSATDVADQEHCNTGALSDLDFTTSSASSVVPAGGSITWSRLSGAAVTIESPNAASTKVSFAGSGTVTMQLSIAGPAGTSCPPATDTFVLTLNTPPTVAITLENACNASGVTQVQLKATPSGGTGTIHYAWTLNGNPVGTDSDTLQVSGLGIGIYAVTVTDGKSCLGSASKKLCFTLQNNP